MDLTLITAALAVVLVMSVLGFYTGKSWNQGGLRGLKKDKRIWKKAPKTRRERIAAIAGFVVTTLAIGTIVALKVVNLWGETLGIAATVGLTIGFVLSYLADADRL